MVAINSQGVNTVIKARKYKVLQALGSAPKAHLGSCMMLQHCLHNQKLLPTDINNCFRVNNLKLLLYSARLLIQELLARGTICESSGFESWNHFRAAPQLSSKRNHVSSPSLIPHINRAGSLGLKPSEWHLCFALPSSVLSSSSTLRFLPCTSQLPFQERIS